MTRRFHLAALMVGLTLTALLVMSAPAGAAQLDLVGGSTFGSPSLYPYQQWADDSYAPDLPRRGAARVLTRVCSRAAPSRGPSAARLVGLADAPGGD